MGCADMGDGIYPRLAYEDAPAAVEWLVRVFGFVERGRKPNPDGSALVWLMLPGLDGHGVVMVCGVGNGLLSPRQLGGVSQRVNVYLDDVDAHYSRAVAGGAEIIAGRDLETVPWGDRRYEAFDLEGHWWHFAQQL
jgi:uncharacterized glyoxalase superfamily protein PhnB